FVCLHKFLAEIGKCLMGEFLIRDVDGRADVTRKGPVRVESGHAAVQDPSVFPVISSEPILLPEQLTSINGIRVSRVASLQILGVDALSPVTCELLLSGSPCKFQPSLIDEGATIVGVSHPDHDRSRICDEAEAFLALTHGAFCFTANRVITKADD